MPSIHKINIAQDYQSLLKKYKSVLFIRHHGVSFNIFQDIRDQFRKEGSVVKFFKSRVALFSFKESDRFEDLYPDFKGCSCFIFAHDPICALHTFCGIMKKYQGLEITGCFLDGSLIDKNHSLAYSRFVSLSHLKGILLRSILTPQYKLASVLMGPHRSFIRVLDTKKNTSLTN